MGNGKKHLKNSMDIKKWTKHEQFFVHDPRWWILGHAEAIMNLPQLSLQQVGQIRTPGQKSYGIAMENLLNMALPSGELT